MKFAKYLVFLSFVFVFSHTANATITNPPIPKPRSEALQDKTFEEAIQSLSLPQDKTKILMGITDREAKARIIDAVKNGCKEGKKQESASVNVKHKICKPAGKPPKGKDGQKCGATGLLGGNVEGMCINGCCVYLKASKDATGAGRTQSGLQQNPAGQNQNNLFGGQNNNSFLKSFGDMFKNLFSGQGGGGDDISGYGYEPYDYYNDNYYNNLDVEDTNLDQVNLDDYNNLINTDDSNVIMEDTNIEQNPAKEATKIDEVSEETILAMYKKEHEKQVTKRYEKVFSSVNLEDNDSEKRDIEINQNTSDTDSGKIIESIEQRSITKNKIDELKDDYSATGFDNSEKINSSQNMSLWDKIIMFLKVIFN